MIPIDRRTLFGWLGLAASPLPAIAAPSKPKGKPVDMTAAAPGYAANIGYTQPADTVHFDPLDHI